MRHIFRVRRLEKPRCLRHFSPFSRSRFHWLGVTGKPECTLLPTLWLYFIVHQYDSHVVERDNQESQRTCSSIAKDPEGLDSDRWIPLRGGARIPRGLLARAGFSQHLECGIHRSESSPEGSFALIPRTVARWAKTTTWLSILCFHWRRFIDRERTEAMFTNGTRLWRHGDSAIALGNRDVTTACPRHPGHCESTEGLWPISDAH